MAAGGMYDHAAAASIATHDAEWLVPHFEKMLYDNALLTSPTSRATRRPGRDDLAQVRARSCATSSAT